ncbi:hypothetical protein [Neobacillus cucumis]|uniref:hypothetical protein n=1 Tax=Neobacillus cucumis TaxID=1740721 RepID=UPI002E1A16BD|nr:hypothetical protein [Neobacillus cucumis]
MADSLTDWIGEDVFFSQNTFYKTQRQIQNSRQLKPLYVDLDLFNYHPYWVLDKLEHEFYKQVIPEPNIIIFSGQGIVLIWLLEPVPYKALPLWQAVQDYFLEQVTIAIREKRRSDGVQKREYYLKQHKAKKDNKLSELKKLLKDNPKAKKTELAKLYLALVEQDCMSF